MMAPSLVGVDVPAQNGRLSVVPEGIQLATALTPAQLQAPTSTDAAAALRDPLVSEMHGHGGLRAGLVHVTRASRLRVAAGMDHLLEAPNDAEVTTESDDDLARPGRPAPRQRGLRQREPA